MELAAKMRAIPTIGLDKAEKDRSALEKRECKIHRVIELYEGVVSNDEICTPDDERNFIQFVNRLSKKELMLLIHHWSFIRPALDVTDIVRLTIR